MLSCCLRAVVSGQTQHTKIGSVSKMCSSGIVDLDLLSVYLVFAYHDLQLYCVIFVDCGQLDSRNINMVDK